MMLDLKPWSLYLSLVFVPITGLRTYVAGKVVPEASRGGAWQAGEADDQSRSPLHRLPAGPAQEASGGRRSRHHTE